MDFGGLFRELNTYVQDGGFVMPPLILGACILWYGLGDRLLTLRRGLRGDLGLWVRAGKKPDKGILGEAWRSVETAVNPAWSVSDCAAYLEEKITPIRRRLNRNRILVKSIVIVAPLAGLLGTVAGMIETFDSLGDGALFAASGGVAGGISQALLTTQMGLVVAIPGVIMGRILDRKQHTLEEDLDQMVVLLSGGSERSQ